MPPIFLSLKLWITGIFMAFFNNVVAVEATANVPKKKENDEEKMSSIVELSKNSAFSAETLPEAVSASINENGKVVAKQTLVKYSPNQAYCVVSTFDKRFEDSEIRVEEEKENPLEMKLITIEEEKINKHLLPVFVRFHHSLKQRSAESHLCDRSFEKVMGTFNMELKKNITIDSFERLSSWRDEAGFIVTDRNQYVLATYKADDFLKELTASDAVISAYSPADLESVLDFDHSVCGATRVSLIEKLAKDSQMFISKSGSEVNGFIAGKGDRVFACYGESAEIAHSLFRHFIETNKPSKITFFTRTEVWSSTPVTSKNVFRYHTRAIPSNLKWNKVFATNMGVHLV